MINSIFTTDADIDIMNPYVPDSTGLWGRKEDLLPKEVLGRNSVFTEYRNWFDGNFTYRNRLEDIPDTYPLTNSNWYATVARNYASIMTSTLPEMDEEIAQDIYTAMYEAIINYFMFGNSVITAYMDDRERLRVVNVDPRNYWRDDNDNQFFVLYKNSQRVVLGGWKANAREFYVREASLSTSKLDILHNRSMQNVDESLYDAAIVFTRQPSYGIGDTGTSIFPVLQPMVEEISALNTRNSYMSAYHGMPIFAYFTNGLATDSTRAEGDRVAGKLREHTGLNFLRRAGSGKELALDGERYKDAKYITWDAEYISKNHMSIETLEHQLGGMAGNPATLINAQGRITSGSALKRIYVVPYTITKRAQTALLPQLQQVVLLAASVSGNTFEVPIFWPNIFDVIDNTSEVNTSISVTEEVNENGEVSEETTLEDKPGPEGNNAGIIQQPRPG